MIVDGCVVLVEFGVVVESMVEFGGILVGLGGGDVIEWW